MQNLFNPSKPATHPFIDMAYQSNQVNAAASLTKRQENLFRDGDHYSHLMEMVHQSVNDEYGAEAVDAQKDLVYAVGPVLEDLAREREKIKLQFLHQIEGLERERYSREKACYDAAVARVRMVNGGSQASVPIPAQPNTMQPQGETLSSMLTHYSDPFRSVYTYKLITKNDSNHEPTFPPPTEVGWSSSDRDYFTHHREAVNHTIKSNTTESKLDSVQPGYTQLEANITPGIRLVPKSASQPTLASSATGSHLSAPGTCSQESDWYYATWPSPPPLRYISQPVPSTPSTLTETIKPCDHTHQEQFLPLQGTPAPGYDLTQGVYGPRSPLYLNPPCDEFGRLSSALSYSGFPASP